jgi:tetratricopeptide (TPR) repeat protein
MKRCESVLSISPHRIWLCLVSAICLVATQAARMAVAEPQAAAASTAPSTASATVAKKLEFKFSAGVGHWDCIYVPLTIGGKQHLFLVDTGSADTIFDVSLAFALGPSVGTVTRTNAMGQRVEMKTYRAIPLQAGGETLKQDGSDFAVQQLQPARRLLGRPIDGVLGSDVLSRYVVRIDYPHRMLSLLEAGTFEAPGDLKAVPMLRLAGKQIGVAMKIDGVGDVPVAIDTGCAGAGFFSAQTLAKFNPPDFVIEKGRGEASFALGGIQENSEIVHIKRKGSIGDANFSEVKVMRGPGDAVGLAILSNLVMVLDFPKAKLYVGSAPAGSQNAAPGAPVTVAEYDRELALDPQDALIYARRGEAKALADNMDGAMADLDRALELDKGNFYAAVKRGLIKHAKGNADGAIADFTQALQSDPNSAQAYFGRSRTRYMLKGDVDGALADINKSLEIEPRSAKMLDSRGILKAVKGDMGGGAADYMLAIADYDLALEIDPTEAVIYYNRGNARDGTGDHEGAISDYNRTLLLNPKYADAYCRRGSTLFGQGKHEQAIADFNHAVELEPKNATTYYVRGVCEFSIEDFKAAIADYSRALEIDPKYASAVLNRGAARFITGDYDGTIADETRLLELSPNYLNAYITRAMARNAKGDYKQALEDCDQVVAKAPKEAAAYETRGAVLFDQRKFVEALADFHKACELDQKKQDYSRFMIWAIGVHSGDVDAASRELKDYIKARPGAGDDWLTTQSNYLIGQMSEADFIAAVDLLDGKKDGVKKGNAWFFVGMKRLAGSDKAGAADAFRKSLSTGSRMTVTWQIVEAEIRALSG